MKIGGNVYGIVQAKSLKKNELGERVATWEDVASLKGWLDLSNGSANYVNYDAKIQDSTHIFLCDYASLTFLHPGWLWDPFSFRDGKTEPKQTGWLWSPFSFVDGVITDTRIGRTIDVTSNNARLKVGRKCYAIQLIDDPMGLHQQLEIYLKYMEGVTDG